MFYKVTSDFSCNCITAEDSSGESRRFFKRNDRINVVRKIVHQNGKQANLVCEDFLLLDVDLRTIYPLV